MGKKPTKQEMEIRQKVCDGLVASGLTTGQVKEAMKRQYGLRHRAIMDYIARARERLRAEIGESKENLRSMAHARYLKIYQSPDTSVRDKLFALQRIDLLLGIESPREITTPPDRPFQTDEIGGVGQLAGVPVPRLKLILEQLERRATIVPDAGGSSAAGRNGNGKAETNGTPKAATNGKANGS